MNRLLAQNGIYASGLEAINDLEQVFLALTRRRAGAWMSGATRRGRRPAGASREAASMIGLIGAEILKLRRRWATYVVPLTGIVLMGLIFLLVGLTAQRTVVGLAANHVIRFPFAFRIIDTFVFVLGSFLAIAYAAAVAGADWSWGIMRVVIARGEGRIRYVLAKAIGFAIVLLIGVLIAYAAGSCSRSWPARWAGSSPGDPLAGEGAATLVRSLAWHAGAAGAVLARLRGRHDPAQPAGRRGGRHRAGHRRADPDDHPDRATRYRRQRPRRRLSTRPAIEWFQFLPFSIGDSVLAAATPASISGTIFMLPNLPFGQALAVTLAVRRHLHRGRLAWRDRARGDQRVTAPVTASGWRATDRSPIAFPPWAGDDARTGETRSQARTA